MFKKDDLVRLIKDGDNYISTNKRVVERKDQMILCSWCEKSTDPTVTMCFILKDWFHVNSLRRVLEEN